MLKAEAKSAECTAEKLKKLKSSRPKELKKSETRLKRLKVRRVREHKELLKVNSFSDFTYAGAVAELKLKMAP